MAISREYYVDGLKRAEKDLQRAQAGLVELEEVIGQERLSGRVVRLLLAHRDTLVKVASVEQGAIEYNEARLADLEQEATDALPADGVAFAGDAGEVREKVKK